MTAVITYETLANDWMVAKRKEAELLAKRREIEAQLLGFFQQLPEEGERSLRKDGYKTVVRNGINVRVSDKEAFEGAIRAGLMPAHLLETRLYETGFKQLRRLAIKQDPQALGLYSQLLPMFEIKPATPQFEVVQYE